MVSLSVLFVAQFNSPPLRLWWGYYKGLFYLGWSQSALSQRGRKWFNISPQWYHTTCGHRGENPRSSCGQLPTGGVWVLVLTHIIWDMHGVKGKTDNSWERGEFIVEVSLPRPTHTLPGYSLIERGAPVIWLNGWSWEVWGRSTYKPSVYTSPAEIWLPLTQKGEVDLLQPWSDFDTNPLVETSIYLAWWCESMSEFAARWHNSIISTGCLWESIRFDPVVRGVRVPLKALLI